MSLNPDSLFLAVDVLTEPRRHVPSLPIQFLSQFLPCERLPRVTLNLTAVTCHVGNRYRLTARSCDRSSGRTQYFSGGGMASKGELPHRTHAQSSSREPQCTIESVPNSQVFRTFCGKHRQQSLDTFDRPANQLLAVFLGQREICRIRLHDSIITGEGIATGDSNQRGHKRSYLKAGVAEFTVTENRVPG